MKLTESLQALAGAIDRTHREGYFHSELPREVRSIPDFVTATNGMQVNFEGEARRIVSDFTKTLMEGDPKAWKKIRFDPLQNVVRQTVADFYVDGALRADEADWKEVVRRVKSEVDRRVDARIRVLTHHHPAWTCGFEHSGDFHVGPVVIKSRASWIRSIDFSDKMKEHHDGIEANVNWRESLIAALLKRRGEGEPIGVGNLLYDAMVAHPAVVSVKVSECDDNLAIKLAELICKTALDCVSLALADEMFFSQQALCTERLPPVSRDVIVDSNGFIHVPGTATSRRLPFVDHKKIMAILKSRQALLKACGEIVWAHLEPGTRKNSDLSMRWATALAWFAEGAREATDSIALAKLGACLDILSSGGTEQGICQMLVNLTGTAKDDKVLGGRRPRTLKQLVADVYNHGRSEILHGNRYDRMEDMEAERKRAFELARIALSESAIRLHAYAGPDEDKAFRTMTAALS